MQVEFLVETQLSFNPRRVAGWLADWLTGWLTNKQTITAMSRMPLEEILDARLSNKFAHLWKEAEDSHCRTHKSPSVVFLPWHMNSVYTAPYRCYKILFNIIFSSVPRSSKYSSCFTLICRTEEIVQLLLVRFLYSPTSCSFLHRRSRCYQHPLLEHPQPLSAS